MKSHPAPVWTAKVMGDAGLAVLSAKEPFPLALDALARAMMSPVTPALQTNSQGWRGDVFMASGVAEHIR